jgi:hypothetical protein
MTTALTAKVAALATVAIMALHAAPARADGSGGMGLQSVAEAMRQDAIRDGHTGWQNGTARLVASGTGYGVAYSGTPQGGVGRSSVAAIVGNGGGNPIVAYASEPAPSTMLANRR